MRSDQDDKVLLSLDITFEELSSLESILKVTQNVCIEKEISSKYYNLPQKERVVLSEERNHYINMLTLALDKITHIKQTAALIEKAVICLQ